jgi:hypothetical protein
MDLDGRHPAENRKPSRGGACIEVASEKSRPLIAVIAGPAARARRLHPGHLRLDAGVADLVEIGEGGACWRPFGVRRQEGVGRLSGTTAPPPRHDQTYEPTDPREHLFPRLELWVKGLTAGPG